MYQFSTCKKDKWFNMCENRIDIGGNCGEVLTVVEIPFTFIFEEPFFHKYYVLGRAKMYIRLILPE